MRLLSWNINGIRTLPSYHPWNTLKTGEAILNKLGADIICFQEVKTTRQSIEKSLALPESYDAFFSFPSIKGGYSGVCVYTKSSIAVPIKAEEGISGRLQPTLKPPLSAGERISQELPLSHDMELMDDEVTNTHNDLLELDKEGRALMIDFGLFILINVYCPNETSDARLPYKVNFHLLLQERVRLLVEVDKREVIVVGDINVCATPIDHCDGELPSNKEEFWTHPARKWFHEWLHPLGPVVDVVRNCWPERKRMFTCWNQKIDARTTNYGTRIDYFLLTKGLLPWFKHGDIQPEIKGSDHCPVYIDLHDQITNEYGQTLHLKDMMKMTGERRDPPRLATRYWAEYSGKQKLLSNFFGKKGSMVFKSEAVNDVSETVSITSGPSSTAATPTALEGASKPSEVEYNRTTGPEGRKLESRQATVTSPEENSPSSSFFPSNLSASSSSKATGSDGSQSSKTIPAAEAPPTPLKRKKMQADSNYPALAPKKPKKNGSVNKGKAKDSTTAQMKLSSFFSGPSSSQSQGDENDAERMSPSQSQKSEVIDVDALLNDSDDVALRFPSQSSPPLSVPRSSQSVKRKNSHTWSTLFARIEPPKCVVHGEPAREFTVNKPGPNKGKAFFICARPVGPGYDAGKDKRLREEVDPQYRCNFFRWSSEVKREALREAEIRNGT